MTDKGKYVTIWRIQSDGSWKVTEGVFNSDLRYCQSSIGREAANGDSGRAIGRGSPGKTGRDTLRTINDVAVGAPGTDDFSYQAPALLLDSFAEDVRAADSHAVIAMSASRAAIIGGIAYA
jgi:hypothetical protein